MQTRTRWKHPMWSRYRLIKYHCEDENSSRYHQYGGRGIKLKAQWSRDFWSFAEWIEQNIGLPTGSQDQLERINNDGDYKPGNLRWATSKENHNNRTSNTRIRIGREEKTLTQWCETRGIWMSTAIRRLNDFGCTPKQAFEFEPHPRCRKQRKSGCAKIR